MRTFTTEALNLDLSEDENGELIDPAAIAWEKQLWEKQLSEGHTIPEGRILAPGELIPDGAIHIEGGHVLVLINAGK
jgi:hypothetical protein